MRREQAVSVPLPFAPFAPVLRASQLQASDTIRSKAYQEDLFVRRVLEDVSGQSLTVREQCLAPCGPAVSETYQHENVEQVTD